MKILHIIFRFLTGGTETMLVDIMNRQVSLGHDVSLLIINEGIDKDLLSTVSKDVKVTHWPRRPGTAKVLLAMRLNAWVRLKNPDAVHLHDPKLPGLLRGIDKKVVYTVHALSLSQEWLRPTVKQVAITEAVRDDVLSRMPDADVDVILNGIDFDMLPIREPDKVPVDTLRIVQCGRLDYEKKGQDILIRALGIIKDKDIKNITVDFIGEGADLSLLQEMANDEGVADRVRFLGKLSRRDTYRSYCKYDLMVHPSRFEGFGLIIAEAMGARVPVAVPLGGGPYEVIDKGRYGYTFAPDSAEAVADTILKIWCNYAEALQKADIAREYAFKRYSLATQVDNYLKLYKSLG